MTLREQIQRADAPVPASALEPFVRVIVDVAQPEKVILFGSAARGGMKPHSDLDFLVIKRGDFHQVDVARQIYRALGRVEYGVDLVVVRPEDVEAYRDVPYVVISSALREGKVVYDAADS